MLVQKSFRGRIPQPDGTRPAIPVQLAWSDTFPLAVKLHAYDAGKGVWIPWEFALELLAEGTSPGNSAGEGDVRISSDAASDLVTITLRSPEGTASLELDWETVAWFVGAVVTQRNTAQDKETMRILLNAALREIMEEAF